MSWRLGLLTSSCFALLTTACNPPAVDPDAIFTIQGRLVQANGTPAADTTVRVFKVDDFLLFQRDSLLHFPAGAEPPTNARYSTRSGADGRFTIELEGRQVNTDGGGGAAWLSVVYQEGGDATQYLATATDWYAFSDTNPLWDAGDLKLWDAGMAMQAGSTIAFDWSSHEAPSGHLPDDERPYFLFAYDHGSADLQWATHTFDSSVDVPRAAFGDSSYDPEYYLVGYSEEMGGSRRYMHRSSLKVDVSGWQSSYHAGRVDYVENGTAEIVDDSNMLITGAANDGDLTTAYLFSGSAETEFYVDLGGPVPVGDILIYNLGIANQRNAEITVDVSADDVSVAPTTWTNVVTEQGEQEFQNWVYLGYSGSLTARWVRVRVSNTTGGLAPYLKWVGEVKVLD